MHSILDISYTEDEIKNKRHQVAELLLAGSTHVKSGNITAISDRDLRLLFEGYDQVFLPTGLRSLSWDFAVFFFPAYDQKCWQDLLS